MERGGTHSFGFSSYEGAAATVEDGRNERSRKTAQVFLLLSFAREARRLRPR